MVYGNVPSPLAAVMEPCTRHKAEKGLAWMIFMLPLRRSKLTQGIRLSLAWIQGLEHGGLGGVERTLKMHYYVTTRLGNIKGVPFTNDINCCRGVAMSFLQ